MLERFTDPARAVLVAAQEHARRLGHHHLGCEHLLLGAAASDDPAGQALRSLGVTPETVERAILGACAPSRGELDDEALAAIGIDLAVVRARIEAAFGPGALTPRPTARRHWWLRQRRCAPTSGHIAFTPRAKKCLALAVHQAGAERHGYVGVEHLAHALVSMSDGMAPRILRTIDVSPEVVKAAVAARYRQAG